MVATCKLKAEEEADLVIQQGSRRVLYISFSLLRQRQTKVESSQTSFDTATCPGLTFLEANRWTLLPESGIRVARQPEVRILLSIEGFTHDFKPPAIWQWLAVSCLSRAVALQSVKPQTRLNLDLLCQAVRSLAALVVAAWGKQIGNF